MQADLPLCGPSREAWRRLRSCVMPTDMLDMPAFPSSTGRSFAFLGPKFLGQKGAILKRQHRLLARVNMINMICLLFFSKRRGHVREKNSAFNAPHLKKNNNGCTLNKPYAQTAQERLVLLRAHGLREAAGPRRAAGRPDRAQLHRCSAGQAMAFVCFVCFV